MIAALGDRVLSIGADSADSSELRFRKRLLVGIALFILPIGFLWGCLYWVVGEEAVAKIRYTGTDKAQTIRTHWQEIDGQPQIVDGEPVD